MRIVRREHRAVHHRSERPRNWRVGLEGTDVPIEPSVVKGVVGSSGEERSYHEALDHARFDADIVALFDDPGEG
jgi:hypothetical protein